MSVTHFASPYGSSNAQSVSAIKQYYGSHRNTIGDLVVGGADDQDINIKATFDSYDIKAVTIRRDTTVAQLQAAIDYTIRNNGWLVLNYHAIESNTSANGSTDDSHGSQYSLSASALEAQLKVVNQSSARTATVGQVMDAINARKAVAN